MSRKRTADADGAPPSKPPPTSVYVVSPSGAVQPIDREPGGRLERGLAGLRAAGFEPRLDRAALSRHQRFAGNDRMRLAGLGRAAADRAPIVITTRGGYGLTRLLDSIDFEALADAGKQWVGFSDFTAFHLGMLARAGAATWAGAALLEDFSRDVDPLEDITIASFGEAMRGELEALGFACRGPDGLDVRGTLWGGNLAVLTSLVGTPWFPAVRGGILFLEDVNEAPFRVERMLTQLLHAGVLDAQRAIVIGHFTGCRVHEVDNGFDLPAIWRWLSTRTRTPLVFGLPFGHAQPKLCLPHGVEVGLAIERRTAYLLLPHSH